MRDKGKQPRWKISTQSVYIFGREERLQSAYETILPTEKVSLKGKENVTFEVGEDRIICSSIE